MSGCLSSASFDSRNAFKIHFLGDIVDCLKKVRKAMKQKTILSSWYSDHFSLVSPEELLLLLPSQIRKSNKILFSALMTSSHSTKCLRSLQADVTLSTSFWCEVSSSGWILFHNCPLTIERFHWYEGAGIRS